jgi:two-component system, NtrC family, nitrogen regulation response regulator GlnG
MAQPASASSSNTNLFIVDSDGDFCQWAAGHLKAPGVKVQTFQRAEESVTAYQKQPAELVIADVRAPSMGGIELLKKLRQLNPNAMVILTSATAGTSSVIEAMRLGAYDFLPKEKFTYEARMIVESALRAVDARRATLAAVADAVPSEAIQETIIGRSGAMQEVFKLIGRVSRSDAPVMVTGESGSGKELVARAVHKFSPRTQKEFAAINITAIPENLMESELFGHEKGSFTGAVAQRVGRFEQCDGGTLFLDEIGDMPLAVQSKLLRVLQEGEFSRVGSNQTVKTDVRVLAATNRNLEAEVEAGNFREDLFYRLNVVRIHIPPLRERREDVRLLAEFFLHRLGVRKRGPTMRFSEDALTMLEAYDWPGNVRELENTIQRACALSNTDVLLPTDIPLGSSGGRFGGAVSSINRMRDALTTLVNAAQSTSDIDLLSWVEKELCRVAHRQLGGDIVRTAEFLGIDPANLQKRLSKDETKPLLKKAG